jgi:hypothetical protein
MLRPSRCPPVSRRRRQQVEEQAVEGEPVVDEGRDPRLNHLAGGRQHEGGERLDVLGRRLPRPGAAGRRLHPVGKHQAGNDLGLDDARQVTVPSVGELLPARRRPFVDLAGRSHLTCERQDGVSPLGAPQVIHWPSPMSLTA